jgi:hypothetical protein
MMFYLKASTNTDHIDGSDALLADEKCDLCCYHSWLRVNGVLLRQKRPTAKPGRPPLASKDFFEFGRQLMRELSYNRNFQGKMW